MTFFDGETYVRHMPSCVCSREAEGVVLACGVMVDGRKNYYIRCATCGRAGSAVAKAALSDSEKRGAEGRTFSMAEERRAGDAVAAERVRAASERRATESERWWSEYDAYLRSDKWRFDKREPVLRRDEYLCQARLSCCTNEATQVHHTTYRHVFDEPLFDLVAVCRECHQEITAVDRQGIPREYREAS